MSLKRRMAHLEAPHGNLARMTARTYHLLRACYVVLSRLDDELMPSEVELWAMAQAEALSGRPPDYTAALQAAWEDQDDP
jgi:hypothetical protein